MNTITKKTIEAQIERLNRETNNPPTHYHLSGAYGGYSLHRMETDGGGISDVFGSGHITKRDLSSRISAMLRGIHAAYITTPRA